MTKGEQGLMLGLRGFNGLELALYLLHRIIAFPVAILQIRQEILQFAEISGHVYRSSRRKGKRSPDGKGWKHTPMALAKA
ncbi:hypothetical protein ACSFA8_20310 [Variovorax sp. RT4R15]|uniref:hypothetical protein n=1 Tax=Variovorax sp. RT4R15 TaxID=3443737 RepID=UPI003F45DDCB